MTPIKKAIVAYLKKRYAEEEKEIKKYWKDRGLDFDEDSEVDPQSDDENCIWEDGYLKGYSKAMEDAGKARGK